MDWMVMADSELQQAKDMCKQYANRYGHAAGYYTVESLARKLYLLSVELRAAMSLAKAQHVVQEETKK